MNEKKYAWALVIIGVLLLGGHMLGLFSSIQDRVLDGYVEQRDFKLYYRDIPVKMNLGTLTNCKAMNGYKIEFYRVNDLPNYPKHSVSYRIYDKDGKRIKGGVLSSAEAGSRGYDVFKVKEDGKYFYFEMVDTGIILKKLSNSFLPIALGIEFYIKQSDRKYCNGKTETESGQPFETSNYGEGTSSIDTNDNNQGTSFWGSGEGTSSTDTNNNNQGTNGQGEGTSSTDTNDNNQGTSFGGNGGGTQQDTIQNEVKCPTENGGKLNNGCYCNNGYILKYDVENNQYVCEIEQKPPKMTTTQAIQEWVEGHITETIAITFGSAFLLVGLGALVGVISLKKLSKRR